MPVAVDNPTLGFEGWFTKYIAGTARERPGAPKTVYAASYNAYKKSNDSFLAAKAGYDQSYQAANQASAELERGSGQALIAAVSASTVIRANVNWLADKGYGSKRSGSTSIQMGDGTYTSERRGWTAWFVKFNAANKGTKDEALRFKLLKNEWSKVVEPIMRAHTEAEAARRGTLVARLEGIRGLPAAFATAVKSRFIGVPYDKTAAAGYAQEYQSNLPKRQVPGTGTGATTGGAAGGGVNWTLILIILAVVVALGAAGYFIFSD